MEVYCRQYYQNMFSWGKYIFMSKHTFQWPKPHVFVLSTCFHGQNTMALANIFSRAKYCYNIFMGKAVQRSHGQTKGMCNPLIFTLSSCRTYSRLKNPVHISRSLTFFPLPVLKPYSRPTYSIRSYHPQNFTPPT